MNTTYVKWNDRTPSFEEIKGKLILFSWDKKNHDIVRIETKTHFDEYDWEGVSFSILSDEPVYCEWEKLPDNGNGHYESTCNHDFYGGTGNTEVLNFSFCPHCGLPIKVIDELKPLQLMGIEPEIVCQEGSDGHLWKYQWRLNETYITSDAFFSKREAIESWNSLVKKLTGEK
jgi:hypothetical protein